MESRMASSDRHIDNAATIKSETRYTPLTFLTRTIPYTILELRKATDLSKSITRAKAPKKLNRFPLIYLTLGRISRTSPGIKLCRYEIDGGVCSDVQCDGLHPTRDLVPDSKAPEPALERCWALGERQTDGRSVSFSQTKIW